MDKRVAAVVVFEEGIDRKKAQEALNELAAKRLIEPVEVQEFDPDMGYPVFYVP